MIQVKVFYTAKLKSNGHVFDSNIDKAPFKFRLGMKRPDSITLSKLDHLVLIKTGNEVIFVIFSGDETVIEGWNVGLQGSCPWNSEVYYFPFLVTHFMYAT